MLRIARVGAHSKNPIGVATAREWINNSLLDDTTHAKCFLHFNSVWFCMNGESNRQNFVQFNYSQIRPNTIELPKTSDSVMPS